MILDHTCGCPHKHHVDPGVHVVVANDLDLFTCTLRYEQDLKLKGQWEENIAVCTIVIIISSFFIYFSIQYPVNLTTSDTLPPTVVLNVSNHTELQAPSFDGRVCSNVLKGVSRKRMDERTACGSECSRYMYIHSVVWSTP